MCRCPTASDNLGIFAQVELNESCSVSKPFSIGLIRIIFDFERSAIEQREMFSGNLGDAPSDSLFGNQPKIDTKEGNSHFLFIDVHSILHSIASLTFSSKS